jgi:hypothetical protein
MELTAVLTCWRSHLAGNSATESVECYSRTNLHFLFTPSAPRAVRSPKAVALQRAFLPHLGNMAREAHSGWLQTLSECPCVPVATATRNWTLQIVCHLFLYRSDYWGRYTSAFSSNCIRTQATLSGYKCVQSAAIQQTFRRDVTWIFRAWNKHEAGTRLHGVTFLTTTARDMETWASSDLPAAERICCLCGRMTQAVPNLLVITRDNIQTTDNQIIGQFLEFCLLGSLNICSSQMRLGKQQCLQNFDVEASVETSISVRM